MLDNSTIRKIESFVYSKPRSVQEIALHISKNWRTADRYIDDIEKNFGTISTRVFRGGTKGALKIVFWASVEKISNSAFQERLEQRILHSYRKEDFSAFDLFQHVDDKNKKAIIARKSTDGWDNDEFMSILASTKKQLIIFSGNLSFINMRSKKTTMLKVLDTLVKKGITIKIICRVDLAGRQNVEKLLELNFKYGKEVIEIRHQEQPVRAFIIDSDIIRIKEIKEPTGKINELDKTVTIFYEIHDKDWAAWLSRIFWKLFSNSVDSSVRIKELNKLK